MSATSPLGAAGALAAALLTVLLLQRRFGAPPPARRFAALDGLRGYAAFLVYIHHAAAWYFVARTGIWTEPPTRLYAHFGQSSVAIFFMITGLLFWSKLLDGRTRPIDWRRLYRSRVLRLAPLFIVFVALLWLAALIASGFRLRVSAARAGLDTLQWLAFTIVAMPDLNRAPTSLFGGAAWSLPYEWWFYLSLPLGAALVRARVATGWLALGAAGALGGTLWVFARGEWPIAAAFLGGIACAFVVRMPRVCAAARRPAMAIVCLAALAAESRFAHPYSLAPLLLLSLAFAIIACGNSLFGILEWAPARGLGEIGYSIYLLHGIVLFLVFGLTLGREGTLALSLTRYWVVVYGCAVAVVVVSFVTFRAIEAPAMASMDRANALTAP